MPLSGVRLELIQLSLLEVYGSHCLAIHRSLEKLVSGALVEQLFRVKPEIMKHLLEPLFGLKPELFNNIGSRGLQCWPGILKQ